MYDGDDGKTHFEQVAFDPKRGLGLGVEIGRADNDRPVISDQSGPVSFFQEKGVTVNVVADPPRDKPSGFHWATRRALAYIVQGQWEIGMTDGTTPRLRPGDFYWVEDHSPACGGHTQRVVGPEWGLEIAIFV